VIRAFLAMQSTISCAIAVNRLTCYYYRYSRSGFPRILVQNLKNPLLMHLQQIASMPSFSPHPYAL